MMAASSSSAALLLLAAYLNAVSSQVDWDTMKREIDLLLVVGREPTMEEPRLVCTNSIDPVSIV
ncbi:hypothetical protein OUZ56_028456 [Daphnia magna]|uniref:Secreted protein n=1 Tax=Daphnia magna TaxID=35525 RepID=A0ABR0B3X5_9CRUS|nr:hypothetical protein OUZ56_028456 [Daphnia magna]